MCYYKRDWLWVRSPSRGHQIFNNFICSLWYQDKKSVALSYAIQHEITLRFGRKWGTELLNTRFPLPTLLYTRYSAKRDFLEWLHNNSCLSISPALSKSCSLNRHECNFAKCELRHLTPRRGSDCSAQVFVVEREKCATIRSYQTIMYLRAYNKLQLLQISHIIR